MSIGAYFNQPLRDSIPGHQIKWLNPHQLPPYIQQDTILLLPHVLRCLRWCTDEQISVFRSNMSPVLLYQPLRWERGLSMTQSSPSGLKLGKPKPPVVLFFMFWAEWHQCLGYSRRIRGRYHHVQVRLTNLFPVAFSFFLKKKIL